MIVCLLLGNPVYPIQKLHRKLMIDWILYSINDGTCNVKFPIADCYATPTSPLLHRGRKRPEIVARVVNLNCIMTAVIIFASYRERKENRLKWSILYDGCRPPLLPKKRRIKQNWLILTLQVRFSCTCPIIRIMEWTIEHYTKYDSNSPDASKWLMFKHQTTEIMC